MLEHLESTTTRPARVVVGGAGGFVGGAIAGRLAANGMAVLALTRKELDLLRPDAAAALKGLQQRRSWLRIAYVLGQPATGLLYKRAALRHQ